MIKNQVLNKDCLDCFGETGTTAIACVNLKRDFIISDKEKNMLK